MVEVFSICSIERRAATPTTRHHNLWRSHSIRATVKINRWQRKPLGELPGRRHPPREVLTYEVLIKRSLPLPSAWRSAGLPAWSAERSHESRCRFLPPKKF